MTVSPSDKPDDAVPGQHQFGPAIDRFDEVVDSALERVRGNPVTDRLFTTASHVGDFSLIWHLIGLGRGLVRRNPRQAIVLAGLLGVESLIVNQGVKRLFKRARPTTAGESGLHVRQPSTSSFPSGHASSATFASSMLASWDGPLLGALWYSIAAVVGTSRAYVRIHHASDVIAGIATGRALAWIARRTLRRFGIDRLL
jgi:membrane-associated phospholipid phosphatase